MGYYSENPHFRIGPDEGPNAEHWEREEAYLIPIDAALARLAAVTAELEKLGLIALADAIRGSVHDDDVCGCIRSYFSGMDGDDNLSESELWSVFLRIEKQIDEDAERASARRSIPVGLPVWVRRWASD